MFVATDFGHRSFGQDRRVVVVNVEPFDHIIIVLLDHQPLVTLATWTAALHLDQGKVALKPFALQPEFQISFGQHGGCFGVRSWNVFAFHRNWRQGLPLPYIPHHDRTSTIVAFWNSPFKIEIRDGVILHMHGEAFISGIKRRSPRDSPRLQHAIKFETKIVVQARGAMPLYDKAMSTFLFYFRRGFWRFFKPAFALIFLERHWVIVV